jgi:hypothetical protein
MIRLLKEEMYSSGKCCITEMTGHYNSMSPMQCLKEKTILSHSNSQLTVWESQSGAPLFDLKGHSDAITCLQVN